eukprot:gene10451-8406_t
MSGENVIMHPKVWGDEPRCLQFERKRHVYLRFSKAKCVLQGWYFLSKGWLPHDKIDYGTAFFKAWAKHLANIKPDKFYAYIPSTWSDMTPPDYKLEDLLEKARADDDLDLQEAAALDTMLQPVVDAMTSHVAKRMAKLLEEVNWQQRWHDLASKGLNLAAPSATTTPSPNTTTLTNNPPALPQVPTIPPCPAQPHPAQPRRQSGRIMQLATPAYSGGHIEGQSEGHSEGVSVGISEGAEGVQVEVQLRGGQHQLSPNGGQHQLKGGLHPPTLEWLENHDMLQQQLRELPGSNDYELMQNLCKHYSSSCGDEPSEGQPQLSGDQTQLREGQPQSPHPQEMIPTGQHHVLSPRSKVIFSALSAILRQVSFIRPMAQHMQQQHEEIRRGFELLRQQIANQYAAHQHQLSLIPSDQRGVQVPMVGDEVADAALRRKGAKSRSLYAVKRARLNDTFAKEGEELEGGAAADMEGDRVATAEGPPEGVEAGEGSAKGGAAGGGTQLIMMVSTHGQPLVKTLIRVPFTLDPTWCIPNRLKNGLMDMKQMTTWPKQLSLGQINSIKEVLEMWDHGVKVHQDGKEFQLAPLRVLEHPQLRELWRYTTGASIGKTILIIKNVVYALHRRVMGFPRKAGDAGKPKMQLDEAIKDLNKALLDYTLSRIQGATANPKASQAGLYKLGEPIITANKEHCLAEYTPVKYEKEVLRGDHAIFTLCSGTWSSQHVEEGTQEREAADGMEAP